MKRKILIVDDIPAVKDFLVNALGDHYEVAGVIAGTDALALLSRNSFDLVITGAAVGDMSGEQFIRKLRERYTALPVIAVTAPGQVETATRMMSVGAFDYVEKPFAIDRLRQTIVNAIRFSELERENRSLQAQLENGDDTDSMVGNSVVLQHVREKIKLVAGTPAPILITGESGSGKEVVAREIHRLSDRAGAAFVKIDCASLPAALLENELFGGERSVVTGTTKSAPGKFELAHNGTILLDEIGAMAPALQARLHRVMQEGEFARDGVPGPIKVNVRVIATTSRNLEEEIGKGRFREDLFYRLNVVPLRVPPLRERREDIPLLITHFIEMFSKKNNKEPVVLTEDAVRKLSNAYWKGNVRMLQNVIERAVILKSGMALGADYFQFENDRDEQMSRVEKAFRFGSIRDMERLMILSRLKDNQENRTRSAETLDISVRTLRNKLHDYDVPPKIRSSRRDEIGMSKATLVHAGGSPAPEAGPAS